MDPFNCGMSNRSVDEKVDGFWAWTLPHNKESTVATMNNAAVAAWIDLLLVALKARHCIGNINGLFGYKAFSKDNLYDKIKKKGV